LLPPLQVHSTSWVPFVVLNPGNEDPVALSLTWRLPSAAHRGAKPPQIREKPLG
jgi:hypothetical protein